LIRVVGLEKSYDKGVEEEAIPTNQSILPRIPMNKKALFLLPGALMLMFAASPLIPSFTNPAIAQNAPTKGEHGKKWEKLNLSADQKAKIKTIRDSAKQQMDGILTAEQKAQLQQAKQTRQRPNLNLTADQKAQMKTIRESTETQIKALLTPEQQQQLEKMHQERQGSRQQRKS
jgi:periplasmic protein CpxP/Spy